MKAEKKNFYGSRPFFFFFFFALLSFMFLNYYLTFFSHLMVNPPTTHRVCYIHMQSFEFPAL